MAAPIYLDYNATTPVDPDVVDAMLPYFSEQFGNPSSAHVFGYQAQSAMGESRRHVAALLNAGSEEVLFTGGGSEGDNLAIKGVVFANLSRHPHVVTTAVEHPAVLATLRYLRDRFGAEFTVLNVDSLGMLDPDDVRGAIRSNTVLITVMHANNEVGTIQPIAEIGHIAEEHGVLLHVDAAQSAGKLPIDVKAQHLSLLTLSGHKVYAPKGTGACFIASGVTIDPLVHGSGQEHGLRAGTEPVASMVAVGAACRIARLSMDAEVSRIRALRDRLHERLTERVRGLALNGHPLDRLPNTLNVSFPGVTGAQVLEQSMLVAASTGSACHSSSPEPSSVLLSMGLGLERALGAVRLSLGRWTTADEIERAADALGDGYAALMGHTAPIG